jgi:hypothetical protein
VERENLCVAAWILRSTERREATLEKKRQTVILVLPDPGAAPTGPANCPLHARATTTDPEAAGTLKCPPDPLSETTGTTGRRS